MGKRAIKLKPNKRVPPCPECGNKSDFIIHSDFGGQDTCDIYAVCKCGYKPSSSGEEIEDVWGSLDDDLCLEAISITWIGPIEERQN